MDQAELKRYLYLIKEFRNIATMARRLGSGQRIFFNLILIVLNKI